MKNFAAFNKLAESISRKDGYDEANVKSFKARINKC